MRSLAGDIRVTLLIKFTLLIILWLICFKGVEKPSMNTKEWLLGGHANARNSNTVHVQPIDHSQTS